MARWTRFRAGLERLATIGVVASDGDEERTRKETLTLAAVLITVLSFVWVGTYAAHGLWLSAAIPLSYQVATVCSLALLARPERWPLFRASQLGLMLVLPFLLQWSLGGFVASSAVALWAVVSPFGALVVQGPRPAVPWFAAFLALLVFSTAIDPALSPGAVELPTAVVVVFFALNVGGVTLTAFLLLEYFVRGRERAHRLLAAERERSEALLLAILPQPIAERLKAGESDIADRSEEVSVLFADLSGFTPAAETLPPEEVVGVLDAIFTAFDELVAARGLEKIKTIGDGYMVAAGIPTSRPDHAERIADLALALRSALACHPRRGELALRIGIDTGPVVAGVIGRTKFAYDLWGDTVNTASRMESHAPPGAIQVTERMYRRLAASFDFERRDGVEVKGKGTMTTYLLLGRKAPPGEPGPLTGEQVFV